MKLQSATFTFHSSDAGVAQRWSSHATGCGLGSNDVTNLFDVFDAVEVDLRNARTSGRHARWGGVISYELNRAIESLPPSREPNTAWPAVAFWRLNDAGESDLPGVSDGGKAELLRRSHDVAQYLSAVEQAIEYIRAGDIFQVNFAQSFDVRTTRSAVEVWKHLLLRAPACYGALIRFGELAIVSNSPELFFRIEPLHDGRRRITTRPIKGTRARGVGMREELERSEKDQAELAMIVDLERNDLGKICEIGSVRVVEPRVIEEHPTVIHGVATIEGLLRPEVTLADVFRAMFPCGSISGCPKVRAMQIIDELERPPRGPYCGAIGYVDSDGTAEFSVAIRTMTIANGVARVSVGGGIVADSDPAEEHRETITKARAMLRALGMADRDIDTLEGASAAPLPVA